MLKKITKCFIINLLNKMKEGFVKKSPCFLVITFVKINNEYNYMDKGVLT